MTFIRSPTTRAAISSGVKLGPTEDDSLGSAYGERLTRTAADEVVLQLGEHDGHRTKFSAPSRPPLRATTVIASAEFVEKINPKEVSMDLMEITEKERLSREQAAARLHALADALARHNEVEFERGGLRFTVHVPDEVDFKLEIEIGEDERELEVELTW